MKSAITGTPSESKIADSIPIDNYTAFDGWAEEELNIDLLILEGPVALDGGKLRWTVSKAIRIFYKIDIIYF